jgi:lipid-binding SYLF domain-containing protein
MDSNRKRLVTPSLLVFTVLVSMLLVLFEGTSASANNKMESNQLIDKAQLTLQSFMCDQNMGTFRKLIQKAQGVLIAPSVLKGAFIVGASGGSGVLFVRDKTNGKWSGPAFYTIGGASFGLQIGGQSSEVVLLAMTDRGVRSFLGNSFKLGGDVGIAAGPVGMGAAAATANLSADILSFSRSKGLYGGISLDGAVVAVRDKLNDAYYGKHVSPADILVARSVMNPRSKVLAAVVTNAAKGTTPKDECTGGAKASAKAIEKKS